MPPNNDESVQDPLPNDQNTKEVVDDDEAKYGKIPEEGVFAVYGTVRRHHLSTTLYYVSLHTDHNLAYVGVL